MPHYYLSGLGRYVIIGTGGRLPLSVLPDDTGKSRGACGPRPQGKRPPGAVWSRHGRKSAQGRVGRKDERRAAGRRLYKGRGCLLYTSNGFAEIFITGGKISATQNGNAPAIGSGSGTVAVGADAEITISGGIVQAENISSSGVAIGAGGSSSCLLYTSRCV